MNEWSDGFSLGLNGGRKRCQTRGFHRYRELTRYDGDRADYMCDDCHDFERKVPIKYVTIRTRGMED